MMACSQMQQTILVQGLPDQQVVIGAVFTYPNVILPGFYFLNPNLNLTFTYMHGPEVFAKNS